MLKENYYWHMCGISKSNIVQSCDIADKISMCCFYYGFLWYITIDKYPCSVYMQLKKTAMVNLKTYKIYYEIPILESGDGCMSNPFRALI